MIIMKKGYVVYGIEFSNGDLYVGSTRDLTLRMYEHKHRSKTSNLKVYQSMREQDFYEFVIMGDIETRKEAYELERKFTNLYKKLGYSLVNQNNFEKVKKHKEDMRKSEEYKQKRRGKDNPNSKPMAYYVKTSTQKGCFKNVCKHQGWNYEDFIEVLDTVNSGRIKKYYYVAISEVK